MSTTTIADRRTTFRSLHERGCFVMPNPWDRGSAVLLAQLGFPALASSSAGYAFTRGLPDTVDALSLDAVLDHLRDLVPATNLPVQADLQNGYAADLDTLAHNVTRCIDTGIAGLSIEDATGDPSQPLFDLDIATARIAAARRAIDTSRTGVLLTARAECYLVQHDRPLEESLRRLQAYAAAGADVLFAPGVRDRDAIRAMVDAVAPKPLNVLIGFPTDLRAGDLGELGVRRISVGSALARCAWTAFERAARDLAGSGSFAAFADILSTSELSRRFSS